MLSLNLKTVKETTISLESQIMAYRAKTGITIQEKTAGITPASMKTGKSAPSIA